MECATTSSSGGGSPTLFSRLRPSYPKVNHIDMRILSLSLFSRANPNPSRSSLSSGAGAPVFNCPFLPPRLSPSSRPHGILSLPEISAGLLSKVHDQAA